MEGKILHRDISENNIIITDPKETNGFTGMLIDADLGKEIGSGKSGARHRTCTMEFLAIQVLQLIDPTYRHDLESILYTLLWICACRACEKEFHCLYHDRPKESVLNIIFDDNISTTSLHHIENFLNQCSQFPQICLVAFFPSLDQSRYIFNLWSLKRTLAVVSSHELKSLRRP